MILACLNPECSNSETLETYPWGEEEIEFACPVCDGPAVAYTVDFFLDKKADTLRASIAAHAAGDRRQEDGETEW